MAEAFLARLGLDKTYAQNIVDMAGSPSDQTDKTVFCMDTGSDSYSFGLTEKDGSEEPKASADSVGIKIYRPEK